MIIVPQDRIRDYRAKGWWGDDTLDDLFRRHLKAHPDAEALIDPFNAADIMGGHPERLTGPRRTLPSTGWRRCSMRTA